MRALIVVAAVGALVLGGLEEESGARPGGGRSYRSAPRSVSRTSPSYRSTTTTRSPSYSGSTSTGGRRTTVVIVGGGSTSSGYSGSSSSGGLTGADPEVVAARRRRNMIAMILLFVVPTVLVIGIVLFVVLRKKKRAEIEVDRHAQQRGIMALKAKDPTFDPNAFTQRTQATVTKINEAWLAGSMAPARRLLSDGVYVRFSSQLALLRNAGERNVMSDWKITLCEVLAAEADERWDTVHVKVVGEARDTEVPVTASSEQVHKALAAAPLQRYHEVWSFIRRRGAQTKGAPTVEGRCPNCGADMPLGDTVRCEYCDTIVNSGEHDWVLAEITQPEEWSVAAAEDEIPGLAALQQRDPKVGRQEIEDRASVIFWKWIEARVSGQRERLGRFVLGGIDDSLAHLQIDQANMKQVVSGSSELVHVAPGHEGSYDQALVELRWSASIEGADPKGMVHVFTLARKTGSSSDHGLSALDCPSCRGPLAESDAPTCGHCGAPVNNAKDWVLATVMAGEYLPPEAE